MYRGMVRCVSATLLKLLKFPESYDFLVRAREASRCELT
jgi:hypothetical protein